MDLKNGAYIETIQKKFRLSKMTTIYDWQSKHDTDELKSHRNIQTLRIPPDLQTLPNALLVRSYLSFVIRLLDALLD